MSKPNECSASATISCGDEIGPQLRPKVDASNADEELWAAARDADEERVKLCLDCKANVDWVKKLEKKSDTEFGRKSGQNPGKEEVLTYRGWYMESQALHVAVLYAADETGDNKEVEQAKAVPVVKMLLSHRADVNAFAERVYFDKEENAEMCRRVQAIHMAAGAGNAKVMELLLANDADKNAEAVLQPNEPVLQPNEQQGVDGTAKKDVLFRPIHDAVLYNHMDCIKLLLREKVEINVQNIDGNTPLHVAANLGYVPIVELLLGLKGARRAFEKAVDQRTEMSLKAPRQGRRMEDKFLDIVQMALKAPQIPKQFTEDQKVLLKAQNKKGRTALELAAKGGRFPVEDIYWFATCLFAFESKGSEERQELVDVFASVAVAFPNVAIDLLRIADESCGSHTQVNVVDPHNLLRVRQALICSDDGMRKKVLEKLLKLSDRYPEAAVVMLDALTTTPEEKHPVIDPLPRRFVPPRDDLYPLHCVYEKDCTWKLDPAEGVEAWHKELAGDISEDGPADGPADASIAAPVPATVHVVNVQGFACPAVFNKLTRQTEDCLFTKLAVHALLKFAWDSMNTLFILDMVYEGAAIIIISRWIVTTPEDVAYTSQLFDEFMNRLAWCVVAGQGTLEGIILTWTAIRHECTLGHEDTMSWAWRNSHRICLSIMTVALACASQKDHWPSEDAFLSAALGATSFGHWLTMLYKVRAFVKTGTRLLPIMKAILPIGGMLVILSFLMVGFMHVFWAMDRSNTNEVNTWQFLTFLFIADNFINDENLGGLSQGRQYAMMVLGGISLFIFTSCSLNLFIAVLSEVYEQEQERMLVTFLKERANICSFLMLRPEIPLLDHLTKMFPDSGLRGSDWKLQLVISLVWAASFFVVVGCCTALQINSWAGALVFVFWAVLQQALLKHGLTKDWDKKYIWYCADLSDVEEIFSLGHSQQDQMLPQNRAWKLKRYVSEIMTQLHKHDEKFAAAQETQKADLGRVEEAQKRLESKLDAVLGAKGASLPLSAASTAASSDCKESTTSRREAVASEGESMTPQTQADAGSDAPLEEAAQAPESARDETSALPDVAATLIGLSPETAPTPAAPAPKKKKAAKSGGGQRSATRASAEQSASQPASGG